MTGFLNTHRRKCVQNHICHESDTNPVVFSPMEIPLESDHMTPHVFFLIQDYMERQKNWAIARADINKNTSDTRTSNDKDIISLRFWGHR